MVKSSGKFPKVLIITNSSINDRDAHGAFLRNYFNEWSVGELAHIFQTNTGQTSDFKVQQKQLVSNDRRYGRLYAYIKGKSIAGAFVAPSDCTDDKKKHNIKLSMTLKRLLRYVINTGIQDVIFSPKCSDDLLLWIENFSPQIIYIQGYSIFYLKLALAINKQFRIPICIHVLDDWPKYSYRGSFFSFLLRPLCFYYFKKILALSAVRICMGRRMEVEYSRRYGYSFVPMLNCDDPIRFSSAKSARVVENDVVSIIYSGSIGLKRWEGLVDLSRAARDLEAEGLRIVITVFTPDIPPESFSSLEQCKNINLVSSLKDEDVPSVFKGADILFLCESFDKQISSYVKLSIATKAHLYMMSQVPILVYGPCEAGVVAYAYECNWGFVVAEKKIDMLSDALRQLLSDKKLCQSLTKNGEIISNTYHDARIVREEFRKQISDAIYI